MFITDKHELMLAVFCGSLYANSFILKCWLFWGGFSKSYNSELLEKNLYVEL